MTKSKKILNVLLITTITLFSFGRVYGAIGAVSAVLGQIEDAIALIAGFVCVIKIIQIGIMYMLSGAGSKGQAKSALMPWVIGTFICGFYVLLGSKIIGLFPGASVSETGEVSVETSPLDPGGSPSGAIESIGSIVLGEFAVLAGAVAIGMLIYIGIKYMTSSAVERAQAKNTLIPWVIGLIIAASASSIAKIIINSGAGESLGGSSGETSETTSIHQTVQMQYYS